MSHLHRHTRADLRRSLGEDRRGSQTNLTTTLAGRKLVDFDGPKGQRKSAVSTGRVKPVEPGAARTASRATVRKILPLTELRAVFELSREELDAVDRGAGQSGPRSGDGRRQADRAWPRIMRHFPRLCAGQDRRYLRSGRRAARSRSPTITRTIRSPSPMRSPACAMPASMAPMRSRSGRNAIPGSTDATKNGYPVIQHVRRLIDGRSSDAPAVDGAVVLSMRGGDFRSPSARISRSAISTTPRRP